MQVGRIETFIEGMQIEFCTRERAQIYFVLNGYVLFIENWNRKAKSYSTENDEP